MENTVEFEPFPRISRLSRGCVITEKIDGTNAQVYIGEDGTVLAGSRNRWITPEDDNYGFAAWVEQHKEELKQLGPGRHYGEWWGPGIQRGYGVKERRFSLFNAGRWSSEKPACCHVVPVLYAGQFFSDTVDKCLAELDEKGSVVSPGFMRPEGVVVFMPQAQKYFKKTLGGDGHKGEGK